MELQPRLFENLPPTREETPTHQLSYPDFSEASNTMWHGREGPSGDRISGLDPDLREGGWNPEGEEPVHVGTFEAAEDRMRPYGKMGGPRRPRPDVMQSTALKGNQMLPFRIREGRMSNTPDMPVSDAYANVAAGDEDNYAASYFEELQQAGIHDDVDDPYTFETQGLGGLGSQPPSLSETGGLWYRNTHEDEGSVSAVVPEATDLEHWPTEVQEHSTSPWDRRMAQFMRGRGY